MRKRQAKKLAKSRNQHDYYNGLCCRCMAKTNTYADKNEQYLGWICGRCRRELEQLPLRHKRVFDRLSKKMRSVVGERDMYKTQVKLFKNYMIAHDLNPDEAHNGYLNSCTPDSEQAIVNKAMSREEG